MKSISLVWYLTAYSFSACTKTHLFVRVSSPLFPASPLHLGDIASCKPLYAGRIDPLVSPACSSTALPQHLCLGGAVSRNIVRLLIRTRDSDCRHSNTCPRGFCQDLQVTRSRCSRCRTVSEWVRECNLRSVSSDVQRECPCL